jgi:hypothetical protein
MVFRDTNSNVRVDGLTFEYLPACGLNHPHLEMMQSFVFLALSIYEGLLIAN